MIQVSCKCPVDNQVNAHKEQSLRHYYKGWKNKTPVGFTRRVKWFQGNDDDIRLELIDDWTKCNLFYTDKEVAQRDMDRFVELCKVLPVVDRPPYVASPEYIRLSPAWTVQREYDERKQ